MTALMIDSARMTEPGRAGERDPDGRGHAAPEKRRVRTLSAPLRSFPARPLLLAALLAASSAIPGCGLILEGGAVGLYLLLESDDGGESAHPPSLSDAHVVQAGFMRTGVRVDISVADAESDPADVVMEYSLDSGASWLPASASSTPPAEIPAGLATSPSGLPHVIVWDAPSDLPAASSGWNIPARIRLVPRCPESGEEGPAWTSQEFEVNVNTSPLVTALTPAGGPDECAVRYILIDPETDEVDLLIEFSQDSGSSWLPATQGSGGQGISGLPTAAGGLGHLFVWDTASDLTGLSGQNASVMIRISVTDPGPPALPGNTWPSGAFTANVNTPPSVSAATPSGSFPLIVRFGYSISDAESDDADVEVEYSRNTGTWSAWASASPKTDDPAHEGTGPLAASPSGAIHTFVWDSAAQVAGAGAEVKLRIRGLDSDYASISGTWIETGSFFINTSSGDLPTASGTTPAGVQMFDVQVSYLLSDASGNPADVAMQYSTDGGSQWHDATVSADSPEGVTGLATSPPGIAHSIVWDSWTDLPASFSAFAKVRIEPSEGGTAGTAWESGVFLLDNRRMRTLAGVSSRSFQSPSGVALDQQGNVYVLDSGSHQVKVLNTQASAITVAQVVVPTGELAVLAGTGSAGYNGDNQPATLAQLDSPGSFALSGSFPPDIFVADSGNHRIRKIDGITGYIVTVAGSGSAGGSGEDGPALLADLDSPSGVAIDPSGNIMVADTHNFALRLVNTQASSVSFAGALVAPGRIKTVCGTMGSQGFTLDTVSEAVPTSILLQRPAFVLVDSHGDVYWSEDEWSAVCAVNLQSSSISVAGKSISASRAAKVAGLFPFGFAGDGGPALSAALGKYLGGFAVDSSRNIFAADLVNSRIRFANSLGSQTTVLGIQVAAGDVDTVCGGGTPPTGIGDGGPAASASLSSPGQVALDGQGNIYIADTGNSRIRVANAQTGTAIFAGKSIPSGYIDTIRGGEIQSYVLKGPKRICLCAGKILVPDSSAHMVVEFDPAAGAFTTVAGTGTAGYSGDGGSALNAALDLPEGASADSSGNACIADSNNDCIRVVNRQTTQITVGGVAIGPGCIQTVGGTSSFDEPTDVFVLQNGDMLVADRMHNRVCTISCATGAVSVLAGTGTAGSSGDGGPAASAALDKPRGVYADSSGIVYIADTGNHKVRAVNTGSASAAVCSVTIAAGCIDTVAGTGTACYGGDGLPALSSGLNSPEDVAISGSGALLVADRLNSRMRSVSATGIVSTAAGTGTAGYNGEMKPPANSDLDCPFGLAPGTGGVVFVSDTGNLMLRRFGE